VLRTLLAVWLGLLGGVGASAGLLWGTHLALAWWTAPRIFAVEHGTIYLAVVLGGGFGAVAGSAVGLAGVIQRANRAGGS